MIIKCPQCSRRMSSLSSICPHCGAKISGNLTFCPECQTANFKDRNTCSQCGAKLEKGPSTPEQYKPDHQKEEPDTPKEKKRNKGARIVILSTIFILILILAGLSSTYYQRYIHQQKEEECFCQLQDVTNPEYFQDFLIQYPESEHYAEVKKRMELLIQEKRDWDTAHTQHTRIAFFKFLQTYPNSKYKIKCEHILDSLDWKETLDIGSIEAVADYLKKRPGGLFAEEANEKINELSRSKITQVEQEQIRGLLFMFFATAIGKMDTALVQNSMAETTMEFCHKKDVSAEEVIDFAGKKKSNDVISIHYLIGEEMEINRHSFENELPGYATKFKLEETIIRSEAVQPAIHSYQVEATLNSEKKLKRINIK